MYVSVICMCDVICVQSMMYVCGIIYVIHMYSMFMHACMWCVVICACDMYVCGEQVWYGLGVLCVNTLACAPSRLLLSAFLRAVTGSGENCV